ncbi:MAG: NAD-dependent epimerase/dehydratase family protein [Aureispira sp.]|nr:NAD-dependent epimerase/dehydratase family protein [Aureispira sp.]
MKNKLSILATGATGFLGGRLVESLSKSGNYNIIATGRNTHKGKPLEQFANVTFKAADLSNATDVQKLCKDIDVVVHSAALSSLWGKRQDFYDANVLATQNIVDACRAQGVKRLVHISTPSIYPQHLGQHLYNVEETFIPKTFISIYGETKYESEKVVQKVFKQGLETIILRPRAIYGRGDYTIMPRVLKAYHAGRLKIIGDGKNMNDMAHVQNVVDAIILSIHAEDKALGEAYNITDGQPVELWTVVARVLKELGLPWKAKKVPYAVVDKVAWAMEKWAKLTKSDKEPLLTRASVSVASHSTTLSIQKAKRLLNYHPKHTLNDGLKEFVTWWKEQEQTV